MGTSYKEKIKHRNLWLKSFALFSNLFFFIYQPSIAQIKIEAPITIDNGLINNEVTAIHQDKFGFLWFGTRGGLNRYDGYDFKIIRSRPQSKNNLSNQSVEVIAEDKDHNLWIGTKSGGLNSYNLLKDSIVHYRPTANIKIQEIKSLTIDSSGTLFIGATQGLFTLKNGKFNSVNNNKWGVKALKVDRKGRVWVGALNGLFLYDQPSNSLVPVILDKIRPNITSIAIDDEKDVLYLGTWDSGLVEYKINTQTTTQFLFNKNISSTKLSNNTYRVFLDKDKNLWVGSWGNGLKKFNIHNKKFESIKIKPDDVHNTNYDIVLSIEQDKAGIIWVGVDGGGVCKINPLRKKFKTITYSEGQGKGLTNTHVTAIHQDARNALWIGAKDGGLLYSKDGVDFSQKTELSPEAVIGTFLEDEEKDLWIGSSSGLYIYRDFYNKSNNVLHFKNLSTNKALNGLKVTALIKDHHQTIWIGTQDFGLFRFNDADGEKPNFIRYADEEGQKGALQNRRISCLLVDHLNRLWVGTYDGLHLYNPLKNNFDVFNTETNQNNTISNNTILTLAEDHAGNIWIGTQQGLNKLNYQDSEHYSFKSYFEQAGFPNDYVHAILVDELDNIWMSTNSGITKLVAETHKFRNFDKRDGVSSNTFSENSCFLANDGKMFFGGISGLTYFYPDSIRLNRYAPPVFITNLTINNTDIDVGDKVLGDKILSRALFLTDKITLSYKEDIVSLSFSALDFHASDKNQYRYKLDGFDKEWVQAGKRRSVTYTNLPPGSYVFKVEGSNSDQIWNTKGAELKIVIFPPPWRTWWAYTLYCLAIIFLLWLSRSSTLSRIKLKNDLHIADLNYKKEHEITEIKSRFFANISHEFRTPLSLIIGPIEGLMQAKKFDPATKTVLQKVQNQSKRLLSLINQLLDYNKAEVNALKLNAINQDILPILTEVYESFADEASRKKIVYLFETNQKQIFLNIDKNKLENIVYNLLSNAFKFTPNGGSIVFKIALNEIREKCEISVSDSGKGINSNDKSKVFDRFYQVAQAEPGKYAGTGIGLAFVKDLVELHHGEIVIEDNEPSGTIIKASFPFSAFFKDLHPPALTNVAQKYTLNQGISEQPILLVVEDNEELNHYISETLKAIGRVVSAKDGNEGFTKAAQIIPDIIISDVMMPIKNGYQLCAQLKADNRTSHIPIILLTAKSDDESHLKGVNLGADSYLAKPFNPVILISYVNNLIENRKKLKDLFAHRLNLEPSLVEVNSAEEEFVKKTIDYIEKHMGKGEFSMDDMAAFLNMSRSTFYRKLKALTGMSGTYFIRLIRLKRSAQLLATGEYTVSTAAYEVGFSDLKYFRKSFQNHFGVNPSKYAETENNKIK
ncbi:response regulator [Pedobacter sp. SD-b]|uniref:histidine kinase n=1 Tax=Pedobacter segetis TaxID=2793069 RepID=A0ABS1BGD4_9SPHI|nr:two-component regulator propeller domain-containing protein [Pedobacter segetis]MBK0381930.1 response regulator [Pedobacter segetis]